MADNLAVRTDDLEVLGRRRFGRLTEAEKRLLLAAPAGKFAMCGPNWDSRDPANDPAKAANWGGEREIRAELVRWLCMDHEASTKINPPGIAIYAAKITAKLDLLSLVEKDAGASSRIRIRNVASLQLPQGNSGRLLIWRSTFPCAIGQSLLRRCGGFVGS